MSKEEYPAVSGELAKLIREIRSGNSIDISPGTLRKYGFSQEQWKYFTDISNDLELNEKGMKILLEEILNGRIRSAG